MCSNVQLSSLLCEMCSNVQLSSLLCQIVKRSFGQYTTPVKSFIKLFCVGQNEQVSSKLSDISSLDQPFQVRPGTQLTEQATKISRQHLVPVSFTKISLVCQFPTDQLITPKLNLAITTFLTYHSLLNFFVLSFMLALDKLVSWTFANIFTLV